MEGAKKEIRKRLDHLVRLNLNDKDLMKVINWRVIPVAGYVMNVYNLGKGDLDDLDMTVKKSLFRRERFNGRISSDERLYSKRNKGGRGLKSFKDVYKEKKARVAYYMAAATNSVHLRRFFRWYFPQVWLVFNLNVHYIFLCQIDILP